MDDPKYSKFNVSTTTYKTVNGQDIDLGVIIPKDVHSGKRPIIAHFHGGFLVTGHALFPDWFSQWATDYTLLHSAIRVSPNYRLFPESNGLEILSDVRNFWAWVQNDLPAYLKQIGSEVTPDYEKVLVYGESAGGYLAIQSGLTRPDLVKAVVAAYPMTYLDSDWYRVASTTKSPRGAPQVPKAVWEDHVKGTPEGKIFTGVFPPDRIMLAISLLQSGGFVGLGDDDSLFPDRVLDKLSTNQKVPFLFAFHGTEDTAVPCEQTQKFVGKWEEKFGKGSVVGKWEKGDHGVDGETPLEEPWLQEGLTGVTKAWLG
jgi:acetyl esterase/lipase